MPRPVRLAAPADRAGLSWTAGKGAQIDSMGIQVQTYDTPPAVIICDTTPDTFYHDCA